MHKRYIGDKAFYKRVMAIVVPIIIQNGITNFVSLLDNIMVGQVGTLPMSGVSIVNQLLFVFNLCIFGATAGAGIFTAQFQGSGDTNGIRHTFRFKFLICLGLTAVGITLFLAADTPLISLFLTGDGNPEDAAAILEYGRAYLRMMLIGLLPFALTNAYAGTLKETGETVVPMLGGIAATAVNLVLNYVFIFGNFGAPEMGVVGAALATVLSQMISAVLPIVVLLRQKEDRLELRKLRIERSLLGRILRIGIPAGLQFVTFDFSNILIQSGINSFGDITMAAWTAHGKTDALVWMISGAFGVSITTFVGQNFGAQKYSRIRQGAWTCLALSIAMVCALNVTLLLFRSQILGIYTDNPEVIAVGSMVMLSIMPYEFLFMPIEVFAGTMRGVGNSLMPTLITGSCVCLFRVVWLMTAVRHWHSLKTLTLSYPLSWALAAAVFLVVYFKGSWLRRRITQCGMEPEVQ